jgi:hypothetical protein
MNIYMGTTQVKPEKTASEVMEVLRRSGAKQIAMDFGLGGKIVGMRFVMPLDDKEVCFQLPVRMETLKKLMKGKQIDQVERTAWRQLLRWVQAQLAMIEVGGVKAAEVYAPFAIMNNGRLLGEMLLESGNPQRLLRGPEVDHD